MWEKCGGTGREGESPESPSGRMFSLRDAAAVRLLLCSGLRRAALRHLSSCLLAVPLRAHAYTLHIPGTRGVRKAAVRCCNWHTRLRAAGESSLSLPSFVSDVSETLRQHARLLGLSKHYSI